MSTAPTPEPGGLLPDDEYRRRLPRKRMGAGVLFRDDAGRPLWVEPTYKPNWEIPGGVVEAGESPWDCAVREVGEELGLHRPLGRLLVVDHVLDPQPDGLMFVFDAGVLDADGIRSLTLDRRELRSFAFLTVADARARVAPRLAGRVAAALEAVAEGGTALCTTGTRIA